MFLLDKRMIIRSNFQYWRKFGVEEFMKMLSYAIGGVYSLSRRNFPVKNKGYSMAMITQDCATLWQCSVSQAPRLPEALTSSPR
jgi:hypothetical protein